MTKKPKRPALSADECQLIHHAGRTWIELSADAVARLAVVQGDVICARVALLNGTCREFLATTGTADRAWIAEEIDVDAVTAINLKRRRRV